ncbi:unnamed protein product, partial [Didymodactylos carnosus]
MAETSILHVKDEVHAIRKHVKSITGTAGALTKLVLFEKLVVSNVTESEHIRQALQAGIKYFLDVDNRHEKSNPVQVSGYLYNRAERQKLRSDSSIMVKKRNRKIAGHILPDFDFEAYALDVFIELMNIYRINTDVLKDSICNQPLEEFVNT